MRKANTRLLALCTYVCVCVCLSKRVCVESVYCRIYYRNFIPISCYPKFQEVHRAKKKKNVYIFTNPSAQAGYDTRSIFKRSLTALNSEISFSQTSCLIQAEEPSLPYYLPIAGGRIIGFIPFPRVLVLCEMQSVSSRILTRVAVSIYYDDNHYTTSTSD